MVFARDGRTLYFRSGTGLYAAPINPTAARRRQPAAPAAAADEARRRRRCAASRSPGDECHRTAGDLHGDHRGRSAGAALPGLQRRLAHHEEPLLRLRRCTAPTGAAKDELRAAARATSSTATNCNTVMMMMIGELNASHTGVSGGGRQTPAGARADAPSRLRSGGRPVRLLQAWGTSTRTARRIATI